LTEPNEPISPIAPLPTGPAEPVAPTPPVAADPPASAPADADGDDRDEIRRFQSAGIDERAGGVPRWLVCVYIAMFLWGAYYMYRYWDPGEDGRGRRVPIVDDLLGRFWPWGAPDAETEGERRRRQEPP
jgi:hypothetical protein